MTLLEIMVAVSLLSLIVLTLVTLRKKYPFFYKMALLVLSLMLILHSRIGGPATAAVLSNSLLGGQGAGLTFVVYGAIIVIIARFLPSGLLSLLERRKVTRAD